MKTTRTILAPILAIILLAAAGTGCVGVNYSRQSFGPDGKPQEIVRARATSLFMSKSFDQMKAAVTGTNESRTFSVSRYESSPDAEAIREAVGAAK